MGKELARGGTRFQGATLAVCTEGSLPGVQFERAAAVAEAPPIPGPPVFVSQLWRHGNTGAPIRLHNEASERVASMFQLRAGHLGQRLLLSFILEGSLFASFCEGSGTH